eukprot:8483847-Lingulodinium_polyedra.AAC.1
MAILTRHLPQTRHPPGCGSARGRNPGGGWNGGGGVSPWRNDHFGPPERSVCTPPTLQMLVLPG